MITISMSETLVIVLAMLLSVASVAIVVSVIYFSRQASQVTRTAAEIERTVRLLTPRADHVLQMTEDELHAIKSITGRLERIASDAEVVSTEARRAAVSAISRAESLIDTSLRHGEALIAGVRAGVRVFIEEPSATSAESS